MPPVDLMDTVDRERQPGSDNQESRNRPSAINSSVFGGFMPNTNTVVSRRSEPTMLNEHNFSIWKWTLKYNLKALQLYECLVNPDNTSSEQNDAAMFEIISTINDKVKIKVTHSKTPLELYRNIEALYTNKTSFQVTDLHMKLTNFKFKSIEHISEGLSHVQNLVAKLKNLDEKISDHMVEGIILGALPSSFRTFITVWKGLNPADRNLTNLTNRLMAEVEDNKIFTSGHSRALMVQENKNNTNRNFNRHEFKNNKPSLDNKRTQQVVVCKNCNRPGHRTEDCRQPKKKPQNNNNSKDKRSKAKQESKPVINYMAIEEGKQIPSSKWVADSGATQHMTKNREWYHTFHKFNKPIQIQCGNGGYLQALGSGKIRTLQGDICDVFFVPGIAANLFSINAAMHQGLSTLLTKDSIKIFRDLLKVHEGEVLDGIYTLRFDIIANDTAKAFITRTLSDWHDRFGHISTQVIKKMANDKIVQGLQVNSSDDNFDCEACFRNKGTKAPHPPRTTQRTQRVGACLHIDTAGPMRTSGLYGELFFVLAKDEASGFRKVACVDAKSEVKYKIKKFINETELETGKPVLKIFSDIGSEIDNQFLREFFKVKGIIFLNSQAYTPQQNGFIERDMRTIGESSRTMLNKSKLSVSLWPEAVKTAVYVLNRVPNVRDPDITPYEKWYGMKPNVKNLRIFGQKAVVNRPLRYREGKWDLTGDLMHFVGYTHLFNTYRFYSKEKDEVIESCDVTFIDKRLEPEIIHKEQDVASDDIGIKIQPTLPEWIYQKKDNIETVSVVWEDPTDISMRSSEHEQGFEENANKNVATSNIESEECISQSSYNSEASMQKLNDDGEAWSDVSDYQDAEGLLEEGSQGNSQERNSEASKMEPKEIPAELRIHGKLPQIMQGRTRSQNKALNCATVEEDPVSYNEAIRRRDSSKWLEAMKDEINSLDKNNVWVLVDRPTGVNIVTNRWVLRIKRKPNGTIDRYRARLVARGFTQVQGLDYNETYAPVVNMTAVRLLFAYAATEGLFIKQFDVKTAFLYGKLEETVYMEQPEGFKDGTKRVCLLKKSLYGLKQAPRQWNIEFSNFLKQQGLTASNHDRCIFYRMKPSRVFIAIYVDDGVIFADNEQDIKQIMKELCARFEIHEVDTPTFLGFQFKYNASKKEVVLHQESYIKKVLHRFNMSDATMIDNPSTTSKNTKASMDVNQLSTNTPYREAIGSLLYAVNITRMDIAYAVNIVSRKVANPTEADWQAVKRILRYLRGDNMSIKYSKENNLGLQAYCDSDFAGDESSKSTTGYIINYGGAPIQWKSQKQPLVTLSSTEAELVSLGSTVKDLVWIRQLAQELKIIKDEATTIYCDNQSAIRLALNERSVQRTRHMGVRAAFTREQVRNKEVKVEHVRTDNQLADFLTKPLSVARFKQLRNKLMFILSLISVLAICNAYSFEDTQPIIWMPDGQYVDGGATTYELFYTLSDPCMRLSELLQTKALFKPQVPIITNTVGQYPNQGIPQPTPSEIELQKSEKLLLDSMTLECQNLWNHKYLALLNEWKNKNIIKDDRFDMRLTRNVNQESFYGNETRRKKRNSLITDFIGGTVKTAGKLVLGGCVSNLLATVFDRLNPNSDHYTLARLKSDHERAMQLFNRNFNLSNIIYHGLVEGMSTITGRQVIQAHQINYMIEMMPRIAWTASFMQSKIMAAAADLRIVIDAFHHGRVAVPQLANLLNIEQLKDSPYISTEFIRFEQVAIATYKMTFNIREASRDTYVYRVNAFNYWENLTGLPSLMEYKGSEYLIFNNSTNCVRSIEKPAYKVVNEGCLDKNFVDPKLNRWKSILQTRDIDMFDDICQIKRTTSYHYIYCFYYNITFAFGTYKMPPNVFRVPITMGYQIHNKTRHVPRIDRINVTDHIESDVIDSIHLGHFPIGSEVLDETKWFDKIQQLHKQIEQFETHQENSIYIVKYGFLWWLVIVVIVFKIATIIVLYRMVSNSDERSERMAHIPVNELPSVSHMSASNQKIKRDKSRIEVGRDESITINLNRTLPDVKTHIARKDSL